MVQDVRSTPEADIGLCRGICRIGPGTDIKQRSRNGSEVPLTDVGSELPAKP